MPAGLKLGTAPAPPDELDEVGGLMVAAGSPVQRAGRGHVGPGGCGCPGLCPPQLRPPVLRTWSCPSGRTVSQEAVPSPEPTSSPVLWAAQGRGETPGQVSLGPGPEGTADWGQGSIRRPRCLSCERAEALPGCWPVRPQIPADPREGTGSTPPRCEQGGPGGRPSPAEPSSPAGL